MEHLVNFRFLRIRDRNCYEAAPGNSSMVLFKNFAGAEIYLQAHKLACHSFGDGSRHNFRVRDKGLYYSQHSKQQVRVRSHCPKFHGTNVLGPDCAYTRGRSHYRRETLNLGNPNFF